MAQFKQPPYPISIEKIKVFITYQAQHGITINTLKSYIIGFSHYFKCNDLPNLKLSNEFKKFKNGLRRSFKEDSLPFSKTTFSNRFFSKIFTDL